MNTLRFGWILVGWMATAGLAQAAMYKWVDENGVTQYTQYPPPGRDYQTLSPPPPPAEDPEGAQKKIEELLQQQDAASKARAEERAKQQQAKEAATQQERNCQIARQNLETLTTGGHRLIIDENGVAYHPTDEDRQARIAEAQRQIEEYCE